MINDIKYIFMTGIHRNVSGVKIKRANCVESLIDILYILTILFFKDFYLTP